MDLTRPTIDATSDYSNIELRGTSRGHFGHIFNTNASPTDTFAIPRDEFEGVYSYSTSLQPVSHFVGRPVLSQQIKAQLHNSLSTHEQSPRILLLHGLGGTGKSQLALDYVRTCRGDYGSVFFIDASTPASTERDYKQIYLQLYNVPSNIGSEHVEVADAIQAVKSWFRGKDRRRLFVFDGADNMDNSRGHDFFDLHRYLNPYPHADVIITTRCRPSQIPKALEVEVGELLPNEAVDLFLCCAATKDRCAETTEEALRVANELGCLALAISLAGAYVAATPHKGVKDYLPSYRKQRKIILGRKANRSAHGYDESVLSTWETSCDAILKKSPVAVQMLSFLSFLNNDDIFLEILDSHSGPTIYTHKGSALDWQKTISPTQPLEDTVDEALEILAKYSLLRWSKGNSSYSMHKLVHAWGYHRLSISAQARYGAAALECLAGMCFHHASDLGIRARLAPHVMASFMKLRDWYDATGGTKEKTLKHLELIARALHDAGLYGLEHDLRVFEYEKRKTSSSKDCPELIGSMHDLAIVLGNQGRYKAGEEMSLMALEKAEKVMGKEDPRTLAIMDSLAIFLAMQSRYDASEEMLRNSLDRSGRILGKDHPSTLTGMINMAWVLGQKGMFKEAETICREAFGGQQKRLGNNHPDTIVTMNNLAELLGQQGKYKAAEEMNRKALDKIEDVMGKEHPLKLTSMNNLAGLLKNQGRYKASEEINRQALEGFEKVLGKEHPHTLSSLRNLGFVIGLQGKHETAAKMIRQALDGQEKMLGKDHVETLASVSCLAIMEACLGHFLIANSLSNRAITGFTAALGYCHPHAVASRFAWLWFSFVLLMKFLGFPFLIAYVAYQICS